MKQRQNLLHRVLIDPIIWIARYFLNIDVYVHATEKLERGNHFRFLSYLILPLFLVSYPASLIIGVIIQAGTQNLSWWVPLWVAFGCLSGIMIGLIWECITGAPVCVMMSLWSSFWLGIWAAQTSRYWLDITIVGASGLIVGMVIAESSVRKKAEETKHSLAYLEVFAKRLSNAYGFKRVFPLLKEFAGVLILYVIGAFPQRNTRKTAQLLGSYVWRFLPVLLVIIIISMISTIPIFTHYQNSINFFATCLWVILVGNVAGLLTGLTLKSVQGRAVCFAVGIGSGLIIGAFMMSLRTSILELLMNILPGLFALVAWGVGTWYGLRLGYGKTGSTLNRLHPFVLIVGIVLGAYAGHGLISFWVFLTYVSCFFIARLVIPVWILSGSSLVLALDPSLTGHGYEMEELFNDLRKAFLKWDHKAIPLPLSNGREQARDTTIQQGSVTLIEQPPDLFDRLCNSSLYWDRWATFLPLSGVEEAVRIIGKENVEQTAELVEHIKVTRPLYLTAVQQILKNAQQAALQKPLIGDLMSLETLRDIAQAPQRLANFRSTYFTQCSPQYQNIFEQLYKVSQDAERYRQSLGWNARHTSLENMIEKLNEISPKPSPRGRIYRIPRDVDEIIYHWKSTAQHVLAELNQEVQKTDQIVNPYVVGQALQPGTKLFVGRRDLVRQLEQGLSKGIHRPTFFLNGERRMGKSSTIRQLPHLLSPKYFSAIFFDLQAPEISSSIVAFLGAIADKIYEEFQNVSIEQESLSRQLLHEANQKNEPAVYYEFNEWLKQVEQKLEEHNRVLLLSFDEFENLESVGQAKYLDLHLLLGWFRSVIQNRPRVALLFSGGKSVSEMGKETGLNWSGYFVNVQSFRVSFLRETEARELITQTLTDYPIEQIFGEGVVDEIIRVTGCHPFLVQAVCSNLVNNLNADNRDYANIQDVTVAVGQVLDDWEDTYFSDLWLRSNQEQRACLIALNDLGESDLSGIAQYIRTDHEASLDTLHALRSTLQILLKRDLVVLEEGKYRIATSIFSQWVERSRS